MIDIRRTIEGTLRTMNNLLERLHASFFFYIMIGPERFLKIGLYLPSAILISVAMMFHGLSTWVDASWVEESISSKQPTPSKWRNRRRPVLPALCIMIAIHLMGALLFKVISNPIFAGNQVLAPVLFFRDNLLISFFQGLLTNNLFVIFFRPSPRNKTFQTSKR